MADTDRDWLRQLAAGERAALDYLFRRYYTELCRAAYRILLDAAAAEDVVQEVFVTLWRQRTRTPQIEQPGPYLRRAVRNRALNYRRDHGLRALDLDQAPEPMTPPDETGRPLDQADLDRLVERAVAALPERSRLVFVLSRYEDLSQKEIAAQMGISVKTVENQMTRALRLLREYLAPYLGVLLLLVGSLSNAEEPSPRQGTDISIYASGENRMGDFAQFRVIIVEDDRINPDSELA
jgi:RNA polymerase sigma-70 factor (ECF subfamily)